MPSTSEYLLELEAWILSLDFFFKLKVNTDLCGQINYSTKEYTHIWSLWISEDWVSKEIFLSNRFLPPPGQKIACRRCGSRISSAQRVVPHRRGQKRSWFSELDSDLNIGKVRESSKPKSCQGERSDSCSSTQDDKCTKSVFVIPDKDILDRIYKVYGKHIRLWSFTQSNRIF